MNRFNIICLAFLFSPVISFAQKRSVDERVDSVFRLMTLEEKIGQLNQYSGREVTGPASDKKTNQLTDIRTGWVGSMLNVKGAKDTREIQSAAMQSRLKIPLLFGQDVIHGYQTVFPVPLGEAASWDLEAIRGTAHIAGKEAAAAGLHWTFAPMVDIARDPRWGRVMEGAGEDAYLGSQIAIARVKGFQGDTLGGLDAIMACAKHFAAYGAAMGGRDYNAVDMSPRQLWETYLPPFKAAVDAGAATFMNSFNTLNGVPATASSYLQRDILKGTWGFKGFVVSDWNSIGEMVPWGYAKDPQDAALKAIIAGSDMDMESNAYRKSLAQLVKDGKVDIALIDDAVKRILRKKFELGLFDDPFRFSDEQREKQVLADKANIAFARDAAAKSIVLLKNNKSILPLSNKYKTIAVIGPLGRTKKDMLGSWVVYPNDTAAVSSVWDGLQAKAGRYTKFIYAKGCDITGNSTAGFAEAVAAAKKADLVIFATGEGGDMTGEAKSRADIHIPGRQAELFSAIKATGKPVVALVMAGRPLIFDSIADTADAILYTWWLGTEAGNAIADVLYGDHNPSGKLPISFPRSVGQIPVSYNYYSTGRPVKDPKNIHYRSAYIDESNLPRFAFGYGLSYTTFGYSGLTIDKTKFGMNETVKVKFRLTNTGKTAGAEVAQLYIWDKVASVARPVKELKGFRKVNLKAGEETTIEFVIDKEMLSFYDADLKWDAEPGEFEIMIGGSSDGIILKQTIEMVLK
jgi:beta-glucosidase